MNRKSKKNSRLSESSSNQSLSEANKQYVKAKRSQKINSQKTKSQQSIANSQSQSQQNQVLDIHHGDSFIRQHVRPGFLKRWDGQSNTLDLTEKQLQNLSPMLRVYWQYKSKNMNCIIFAQIGRVQFFAFEDDAIKLHQIFKKKLKKFSSFLMVNFWSKQIQLAKIQLFERKIPVLMLNEVMDDQQYKKKHGIYKRQITQVITPSIFLTMQPKTFRQRMMLAVYTQENRCGVACVDVETNHFYLQQYQSQQSNNIHQIRRLINKYRPAQLLIQKKDNFIKKIAKQICDPYIIELVADKKNLVQNIKQMKQVSQDQIFNRIQLLHKKQNKQKDSQFSLYSIVKVLSLLLSYMKNLTLQTKIFGQGIFQICDFQSKKLRPMFDAQVYQNLQVFNLKDQQDSFGKPGTLYNYLNHCVTHSGLKLLKKWIDQPLRNVVDISKRQIAIENLLQNDGQALNLHKQLMRFQKLQRRVGGIYHWALKPGQQGKILFANQINFQKQYDPKKNPAVLRIKQVFDVLKIFANVQSFFKKMSKANFQSQILKKNCKIVEAGDLYRIKKKQLQQIDGLPSIQDLLNKILSKIQIDNQTGLIQPAPGINQVFDAEKQAVNNINNQLQQILSKWKKALGVSKASYVSIRARNQLQVPLSQIKSKKFPELIFSSQTSKMIRYIVPQVANLTEHLIIHEQAVALAYQPFSSMMIKQFCAHKQIWDLYVNAIAKIDVLMSLAKTSASMSPRCLPIFADNGIHIKKGHHIGLMQVMKKQNIVPNTLKFEQNQRVLLLTGPNMGGKSTLLRQTCLLAILAQIGCFLPCERYQAIVFDQIFCRIGASDRIIQGKSTFYVELQQTKRIIDQATPDSLVIIDELGRGTSTYDGMALASSILKYIIQEIQCYTLFSTHYFALTEQYMSNPSIFCGKIGYTINEQNAIKFTYQLQRGIAQKSFANQVALQVGLTKKMLQIADEKAQEIEISSKIQKIKLYSQHQIYDQVVSFLAKSDLV